MIYLIFILVILMNNAYGEKVAFINAKIFDGTSILKEQAFLVENERFSLIGTNLQVKSLTNKIVDLKNSFVMPGFIDAHAHIFSLGRSLSIISIKNFSLKEILNILSVAIKNAKPNELIMARGWDQNLWPNKDFPTAFMLDKISPNNPVCLIRTDGHAYWVNSFLLKKAHITSKTLDINGGAIIKDKQQQPTGILIDNAMDLITPFIKEHEKNNRLKYINKALDNLAKNGITSVHDASMDKDSLQILQNLTNDKKLPLRIYAMLDGNDEALVEQHLKKGPIINDYLTIKSIKYFMDGALGSKGALLFDHYLDDGKEKGLQLISNEQLSKKVQKAVKNNFQVATHAIGDKANSLILDIYENFAKNNARLRIEHAQIITAEDQKRFNKLNVIASMQPIHCISDMHWIKDKINNKDLEQKAYPWASLLKHSAIIAFGSDAPVEDANPFLGLYAAVTRKSLTDDKVFFVSQALKIQDALNSYYTNAAYAEFNENNKGKIKQGYLADFIVLEKSIFEDNYNNLKNIKVLQTFVGGKNIFSTL